MRKYVPLYEDIESEFSAEFTEDDFGIGKIAYLSKLVSTLKYINNHEADRFQFMVYNVEDASNYDSAKDQPGIVLIPDANFTDGTMTMLHITASNRMNKLYVKKTIIPKDRKSTDDDVVTQHTIEYRDGDTVNRVWDELIKIKDSKSVSESEDFPEEFTEDDMKSGLRDLYDKMKDSVLSRYEIILVDNSEITGLSYIRVLRMVLDDVKIIADVYNDPEFLNCKYTYQLYTHVPNHVSVDVVEFDDVRAMISYIFEYIERNADELLRAANESVGNNYKRKYVLFFEDVEFPAQFTEEDLNDKKITEKDLAVEFIRVVRSQLTPEEINDVVRKNRTEEYIGCCATHDYVDANELMNTAYVNLTGNDIDTGNSMNLIFTGRAWDMAKAAGFDESMIRESEKFPAQFTDDDLTAAETLKLLYSKIKSMPVFGYYIITYNLFDGTNDFISITKVDQWNVRKMWIEIHNSENAMFETYLFVAGKGYKPQIQEWNDSKSAIAYVLSALDHTDKHTDESEEFPSEFNTVELHGYSDLELLYQKMKTMYDFRRYKIHYDDFDTMDAVFVSVAKLNEFGERIRQVNIFNANGKWQVYANDYIGKKQTGSNVKVFTDTDDVMGLALEFLATGMVTESAEFPAEFTNADLNIGVEGALNELTKYIRQRNITGLEFKDINYNVRESDDAVTNRPTITLTYGDYYKNFKGNKINICLSDDMSTLEITRYDSYDLGDKQIGRINLDYNEISAADFWNIITGKKESTLYEKK